MLDHLPSGLGDTALGGIVCETIKRRPDGLWACCNTRSRRRLFTRVTILRAKLGASTDARLFAKTNNKQDNKGNGIDHVHDRYRLPRVPHHVVAQKLILFGNT
jgi:hypothetical protein